MRTIDSQIEKIEYGMEFNISCWDYSGIVSSNDQNANLCINVRFPNDLTFLKYKFAIFDGVLDAEPLFGVYRGIDAFTAVYAHENVHVEQSRKSDNYLYESIGAIADRTNSIWRFGWSFRYQAMWEGSPSHNHFSMGSDGNPGRVGCDDDNDNLSDNTKLSPPSELGRATPIIASLPGCQNSYDDILLSESDTGMEVDWAPALGAFPTGWEVFYGSPWEVDAFLIDLNDNYDKLRDQDWGNPGKQYRGPEFNE